MIVDPRLPPPPPTSFTWYSLSTHIRDIFLCYYIPSLIKPSLIFQSHYWTLYSSSDKDQVFRFMQNYEITVSLVACHLQLRFANGYPDDSRNLLSHTHDSPYGLHHPLHIYKEGFHTQRNTNVRKSLIIHVTISPREIRLPPGKYQHS